MSTCGVWEARAAAVWLDFGVALMRANACLRFVSEAGAAKSAGALSTSVIFGAAS